MLYDRDAMVAGKEYEQVIENVDKKTGYCRDCKHRKDKKCAIKNEFVAKKGTCSEYARN